MSAYVYGIICAALAIGVTESLLPESAKTRPYLKLIFGLALLLVIVRPLGELARMLPDLGGEIILEQAEDNEYAEIADEALGDAYRDGIKTELEATFGLKDFEVGILMGDDRRPKRITVTLMGSDIFRDPYKIENHLGGAFGCECIVVVG